MMSISAPVRIDLAGGWTDVGPYPHPMTEWSGTKTVTMATQGAETGNKNDILNIHVLVNMEIKECVAN